MFTDTPLAGIDLDHCLRNGRLTSQAARIVAQLSSYTEISPSRTGLHVIVRGCLPPGSRRKGDVEMYDTDRYFTVTGHVWRNFRIVQRRQTELECLHAHLFGHPGPRCRPRPSPLVAESVQELLRKATSARNGDKFARLWGGDFSDYDSHSEADLALCNFLAFWTGGDAARMDRLFRQSGLFRPKWDEKHYANGQTYGQGTLERALAERTAYYQATRNAEPPRVRANGPKQSLPPHQGEEDEHKNTSCFVSGYETRRCCVVYVVEGYDPGPARQPVPKEGGHPPRECLPSSKTDAASLHRVQPLRS